MNTEYGNFINFVEPSPEDALKGIYAHLTTLKECPEELAEVIKDLNVSATQSPSFSYGVKERIFAHFTIASYRYM
jgi:hypothetical protein